MKQKINWKQTLITSVITVAVTVIAGMILFHFQSSKVDLKYDMSQVSPFQKEEGKLTIYHIILRNEGKKMAEDIKGSIDISPAKIKDYIISTDFPLNKKSIVQENRLNFDVENINFKEKLVISILASSTTTFPKDPVVKIRAIGCSAVLENNNSNSQKKSSKSDILIFITLGVLASFVASFIPSKIKNKSDSDKGKLGGVEQQHSIAYLLELEGFKEMAENYRKVKYKVSYWSESDSLTFKAMNKDREYILKIIRVFENLLDLVLMAEDSEAVINHNISKMYNKIGEMDKSEEFLKKAQKINAGLINKRIEFEKKTLEIS